MATSSAPSCAASHLLSLSSPRLSAFLPAPLSSPALSVHDVGALRAHYLYISPKKKSLCLQSSAEFSFSKKDFSFVRRPASNLFSRGPGGDPTGRTMAYRNFSSIEKYPIEEPITTGTAQEQCDNSTHDGQRTEIILCEQGGCTPPSRSLAALSLVASGALLGLSAPGAASALALAVEPPNALSLPTWVIHVASVVEWVAAMVLVWQYGGTPERSAWRGMAWAMVPLLLGAMCACTWHFFYNDPDLDFLVVLQSFSTLVGNCTLCAASYRIFLKSTQKEAS